MPSSWNSTTPVQTGSSLPSFHNKGKIGPLSTPSAMSSTERKQGDKGCCPALHLLRASKQRTLVHAYLQFSQSRRVPGTRLNSNAQYVLLEGAEVDWVTSPRSDIKGSSSASCNWHGASKRVPVQVLPGRAHGMMHYLRAEVHDMNPM